MQSILSIIALLGITVFALPGNLEDRSFSNNGKTCKTYSTTSTPAQFDELGGVASTSKNAIPIPYKGLSYEGFTFANVFDLRLGLLAGVAPQSRPNYAVARGTSSTAGATVVLTTNYAGNTPDTKFSPKSFYYSCSQTTLLGLAALPARCSVVIKGYKGPTNDITTAKQVCIQTFAYNPASLLGTSQVRTPEV